MAHWRPWLMRTELFGGEVQVSVRNRQLVLRALSPLRALRQGLRLCPVDAGDPLAFQVAIEGLVVPVVFGRGETGRVDCLAAGGPAFVPLHKRPSVTSYRRGLRASAILAGASVLRLRRKAVASRVR